MRTWKNGAILADCSILELEGCVAVADAAWWGVAKDKIYSWNRGGG